MSIQRLQKKIILKNEEFKKSNQAFKTMTKELKKQGLAVVEHYSAISNEHLDSIYTYLLTDLF